MPFTMHRFSLATFVFFSLLPASTTAEAADGFVDQVKPFVTAYCVDCHGPDEQKAGLRLDTLATDLTNEADFAKWVRVHDKIVAGEMPPPESERPPQPEVANFT